MGALDTIILTILPITGVFMKIFVGILIKFVCGITEAMNSQIAKASITYFSPFYVFLISFQHLSGETLIYIPAAL
jgi:hypothetical protein